MADTNYTDKEFVDDLIRQIENAKKISEAQLNEMLKIASRALDEGKIKDKKQAKRLKQFIQKNSGPFN